MSYKFDCSRAELVYSTAYHRVKNSSSMNTSIDSPKKRVTSHKPTKMVEFYLFGIKWTKPASWIPDLRAAGITYNIVEI